MQPANGLFEARTGKFNWKRFKGIFEQFAATKLIDAGRIRTLRKIVVEK